MCESPVICDLALFKLQMGLFGIIKQICHASEGNMMECFPSGGWFSLGLRPREKPSSLGVTFHHVTLTGMAYLYIIIYIYCRIVVVGNTTQKAVVAGSAIAYRFDEEMDLELDQVSDAQSCEFFIFIWGFYIAWPLSI